MKNLGTFLINLLIKKRIIFPLPGKHIIGQVAQKYASIFPLYTESLIWDNGITPSPFPSVIHPGRHLLNPSITVETASFAGYITTEDMVGFLPSSSYNLGEKRFVAILKWPETNDMWYFKKAIKRKAQTILTEAKEKGIEPESLVILIKEKVLTPAGTSYDYIPLHFFLLGLEAKKRGYALLLSHLPAGHFVLAKAKRGGFWEEAKGVEPQGRIGFFAFPVATAQTINMAKQKEFFPTSIHYFTFTNGFPVMGLDAQGRWTRWFNEDISLPLLEQALH